MLFVNGCYDGGGRAPSCLGLAKEVVNLFFTDTRLSKREPDVGRG